MHITHHERVEGHPHRWHVFLHGHDEPIHVELSPEHRAELDMTDEEIHEALPHAVERKATVTRDDELSGYGAGDQPLGVDHMHLLVCPLSCARGRGRGPPAAGRRSKAPHW